MSSCAGKKITK